MNKKIIFGVFGFVFLLLILFLFFNKNNQERNTVENLDFLMNEVDIKPEENGSELQQINNDLDSERENTQGSQGNGTLNINNTIIVDSRRYFDGTYSANGVYNSPAGREDVKITLVIKDDKVASAFFEGFATHRTSIFLQEKFNEGFETQVVGKSIDEINLNVINGSSLTPKGFMDALEKIKLEAKVS